jgi:hypothetical protein
MFGRFTNDGAQDQAGDRRRGRGIHDGDDRLDQLVEAVLGGEVPLISIACAIGLAVMKRREARLAVPMRF